MPFSGLRWGEMLLASGDLSMWLMLDRSTVEECSSGAVNGQWFPPFVGASSATEGGVTQYCRSGAAEDPWLSVHEHPDGIVYGENSYAGHNTDDALNAGQTALTAEGTAAEPPQQMQVTVPAGHAPGAPTLLASGGGKWARC